MDEKRGQVRTKRQAKVMEDSGKWDCTVCTFKNPPQAFKCEICDVRKGTSTRKPRINPDVAAQQVVQQFTPPPPPAKKEKLAAPKKERSNSTNSNESSSSRVSERERSESPELEKPNTSSKESAPKEPTKKTRKTRPKLKNIDRSSAQHIAVTVNNITVIITDFKPKKSASKHQDNEEFGAGVKQEQTGD